MRKRRRGKVSTLVMVEMKRQVAERMPVSLLLWMLAGYRMGVRLQRASDALSAFCIYTVFSALSGTAESFLNGVAVGVRVAKIWSVEAGACCHWWGIHTDLSLI